MKFFTYHDGSKERVGVLSPDGTTVYPVSSFGLGYNTMIDLIKNMSKEEKQDLASRLACPQAAGISFQDATLLAPIPLPRDILAVGGVGNFAAHVEETCRMNGVEYVKPEYCCYFCKRVNRAVPPGGKICLHEGITSMLDYEIELAVVIGKECSRVTEKDAFDYVFGYTIVNDITARDIQKNLPQYGYAKGLDDTTPMGPCIVTADEIPDPHNLRLTLKVNGEMRQNSITNDLIFNIPYIISDLSKGMTLFPGDIFLTGSPAGIGAGMDPPRFLKHGDIIESEIEGIGILENTIWR